MGLWDTLDKIPDPVYNFGGNALMGIGSLLGGDSYDEKQRKRLIGTLQGQMNKPVIGQGQINSFLPNLQAGLTPMLNQLYNSASQKVGLKSGVGAGEIATRGQSQLQELLGQLQQRAMFTNAQAPLQRQSLLASLLR